MLNFSDEMGIYDTTPQPISPVTTTKKFISRSSEPRLSLRLKAQVKVLQYPLVTLNKGC